MVCPSTLITKEEFDRAYGSKTGDSNYDIRADMNKDGVVDWHDFTMFAACYSPPATPPPSTSTDKDKLTIVIIVIIIVLVGIFLLKK